MNEAESSDKPLQSRQSSGGGLFAPTEWSVVCETQATDPVAAHEALARLCETYWYPLYAYVRRRGYSSDDAEDLTQDFFVQLMQDAWLAKVHRAQGRFRWFLLMAMKRFLTNEWHRAHAEKRGGRVRIESLSSETGEVRMNRLAADRTGIQPEAQFEREWAITLLDGVIARIRKEYADAGRARLFDSLKAFLLGRDEDAQGAYAAAAGGLDMSEGSVRVAVCRLRHRYREALRQEIGRTVAKESDIDGELRHLVRILGRSGY